MKKIKFKEREIKRVAESITSNSELFGDEVISVISQLAELSDEANKYGCRMEGKVDDMWGCKVPVVALPNHYRSSWSF